MRALRGATTAEADTPGAIRAATAELLGALLERNDATPKHLISIVFTATDDLRSEFPATAARDIGISDTPLLCAAEIAVPESVPRCIRVLMHLYTTKAGEEMRHVYLRDARRLRADLADG